MPAKDSILSHAQIATMPAPVGTPQTLYDKVLSAHIVDEKLDGTILLYIGKFESFTAFCIEKHEA